MYASDLVTDIAVDAGLAGAFDKACPKPNLDFPIEDGVVAGLGAVAISGVGDGIYPVFVGCMAGKVSKIMTRIAPLLLLVSLAPSIAFAQRSPITLLVEFPSAPESSEMREWPIRAYEGDASRVVRAVTEVVRTPVALVRRVELGGEAASCDMTTDACRAALADTFDGMRVLVVRLHSLRGPCSAPRGARCCLAYGYQVEVGWLGSTETELGRFVDRGIQRHAATLADAVRRLLRRSPRSQ